MWRNGVGFMVFSFLCLISTTLLAINTSTFSPSEINTLVNDVKVSGWSQARKLELFSASKLGKMEDMIKVNVTEPIILTKDKYQHFLEKKAISKAHEFRRKWRTVLARAETKYKVDLETIVAIILVETRFGQFVGKYPVLSVYASTYVDAKRLLEQKSNDLSAKLIKRVKRKRDWALGELRSLLTMKAKYQMDILSLKGSYAGAFGLCQFLPSSFLSYSAKYVGKGKPDLFWEPDAIFSIGRYLSKHGYRAGKTLLSQRNKKAVRAYNNSDVYVDIVLGAAERIKKKGLPKVR